MTDFDSRSFISTESVENLETQEVATTPTIQNAKRVVVVDASGNPVSTPPSTASITSVAGAAADTPLLAANTSRRGLVIFNDSTAILYVALTEAASTTNFSYRLTPYGTLELLGDKNFTGVVKGIWASATGNARITELTA